MHLHFQGVFEFDKSLLARLEESETILCNGKSEPIPASKVRSEWANFIEIAVEPAGWRTMWHIPRVICEELKIQYPTLVWGTVEQVLYNELRAIFVVETVEDETVQIPEKNVVALEELYPTKVQENDALNIDLTADAIDKLRFFYHHIWMPWDNDDDDDLDWAGKHLQSRIKFYYDLKNKTMSRALSQHIRILLTEADYIQKRVEYLEMDIEDDHNMDQKIEQESVSKLMRLHLRLNIIKNEIDMLENPEMRNIFETIRFPGHTKDNMTSSIKNTEKDSDDSVDVYIVVSVGTLNQQTEYLEKAKSIIGEERNVQICSSLQGALDICNSSNEIFISPGQHPIKFLEYLNSGGAIKAISNTKYTDLLDLEDTGTLKNHAVILSHDDDSILLTIDGDFTFENIIFNCKNVRKGVFIKKGNITFKNCLFLGTPDSSLKQGIVVSGDATVTLDTCVMKHFAHGIYSNSDSQIDLKASVISDCFIGLASYDDCKLNFSESRITNCKQYGVMMESTKYATATDIDIYNDLAKVELHEITFEGNCRFNNVKGNVAIKHRDNARFHSSCLDNTLEEAQTENKKRKTMMNDDE